MSNKLPEDKKKIYDAAVKVNHFCGALYEYYSRLQDEMPDRNTKLKEQNEEIAKLQKEADRLEEGLKIAKNNMEETKAILLSKYKFDVDALETEEKL